MRPIDADALRDEWLYENGTFEPNDVLDSIDIQPTITAPRWVRCKDEMPKDGDWVLIWAKAYTVTIQAFHESGAWIDDRFEKYTDVTHWMPLPEPPKEGE